jgi:hypothetical protein
MPMRWRGRFRKRWRWVGAFAEELLLFAASVEVGPAAVGFWGVWDRERRRLWERTRRALPGRRPEVRMSGRQVRIESGEVRAELLLGDGAAIESMCPNGEGGYTWTRKLAGVPTRGHVVAGGRRIELRALAAVDDSAGYHRRRTSWLWSTGVGTAADGRGLAWNLVSGINDPPRHSERAVWVEGAPHEPGPVEFEGLEAIRFQDGSRLEFEAEAERVHSERVPLLASSDYRAPLGSFRGALDGIELASGLGVMESHDVLW